MPGKELRSITFFYPSRIVGGAEFLFIRLAAYIRREMNIPVYVVDYADGFLRKSLQGTGVEFIEYHAGRITVIDYETVIIVPLNFVLINLYMKCKHDACRIFFWCVHADVIGHLFRTRGWFASDRQSVSRSIRQLISASSLAFMDRTNYLENARLLQFELEDIPYLPIPCPEYEGDARHVFRYKDEIAVGWLGRLSADKTGSILNMIDHLDRLPATLREKITCYIIGQGEEEKVVEKRMAQSAIRFEKAGTLVGEELNHFLAAHIDIGFAMGTSALEFAKLYIPVVLVDMYRNNQPVEGNRFQWLYESESYTLGLYHDSREREHRHTMADVLHICSGEQLYTDTAEKNYRYYLDHHRMDSVAKKLVVYAQNTSTRPGDAPVRKLQQIFQPFWLSPFKYMWDLVKKKPVKTA